MFDERTTVVIATRNRATELKRTIVELLTLDPGPPVIVVDNGSQDATGPDMRAMSAGCPQLRYIRLRTNQGAAARNVGIRAAATPYVAFSDDDSWWERGALTKAADLLDAHPRLAMVAARTLVGEEARPDPLNEAMAASPLETPDGMPGPAVLGFLACAAVARRSALMEAGGFNGLLRFAGEEQLLAWDLAVRDWRICYCPAVTARHVPSVHRPPSEWRRARERRNRALAAWLRRPVGAAWSRTWELARAAAGDRHSAAAFLGLLARMPLALAARRRLPQAVEAAVRTLETEPARSGR